MPTSADESSSTESTHPTSGVWPTRRGYRPGTACTGRRCSWSHRPAPTAETLPVSDERSSNPGGRTGARTAAPVRNGGDRRSHCTSTTSTAIRTIPVRRTSASCAPTATARHPPGAGESGTTDRSEPSTRLQPSRASRRKRGLGDTTGQVHEGDARRGSSQLRQLRRRHAVLRSQTQRRTSHASDPQDQSTRYRHVPLHRPPSRSGWTCGEAALDHDPGRDTGRLATNQTSSAASGSYRVRSATQMRGLRHGATLVRPAVGLPRRPHRRKSQRFETPQRPISVPQLPHPDTDLGRAAPLHLP